MTSKDEPDQAVITRIHETLAENLERELQFVEVRSSSDGAEIKWSNVPNVGIKLLRNSTDFIRDIDADVQDNLISGPKRRKRKKKMSESDGEEKCKVAAAVVPLDFIKGLK